MKNTCKIILRSDFTYANGNKPVYLQAFIQKKRILIPLNISIDPLFFDKKSQFVKNKYSKARTIVPMRSWVTLPPKSAGVISIRAPVL